jgi:ABC-type Na+ efflux pump permease subunit
VNKILAIAAHEFWETVKTKAFIISVVLMPGLILGAVYATERIARMTAQEALPTRQIAVLDATGVVLPLLHDRIEAYNAQRPNQPFEVFDGAAAGDPSTTSAAGDSRASSAGGGAFDSGRQEHQVARLTDQIRAGALYAYIVIPRGALDSSEPCVLARKDAQISAGRAIESAVNEAVVDARFSAAGLQRGEVQKLEREVELRQIDAASGAEVTEQAFARVVTPFAFMFLLFMGTMQISYGLLSSLLEEKSSRVIEVLLAAISPTQLMAGKILGMVAVGLTLMAAWGGAGYLAAEARGAGHLVTWFRLGHVAMYFLPAFLFFAAFLGAIGSVCNTLKEAQSLASPLSIMNIIPMILWFQITEAPQSLLSVTLSFIPPMTPFVMVLRICADPATPVWQIAATLVLLWATALGTIWAAGRIFRVGVLMYGKPPSLGELARWVRYA